MAKAVNDVLAKIKGTDKVSDVVAGKGSFSKTGFSDLVSAMANDTTFKIPEYKDGKKVGEVSVADLLRNDFKKSVENAKYPQKSEADVLDKAEISTKGTSEAIGYIIKEWLEAGKKFDIPEGEKYKGSIYLKDVKGGTREFPVRDPQTQKSMGTMKITSKDSIAVAAKSPVPDYLQKKERKA